MKRHFTILCIILFAFLGCSSIKNYKTPGKKILPKREKRIQVVYDEVYKTPRSILPIGTSFIPLLIPPGKSSDPESIARAFFRSYKSEYLINDSDAEMKVYQITRDSGPYEKIGMTHIHIQQTYQNLPIFCAQAIIHLNRELKIASVYGRTIKTPVLKALARITAATAKRIALDHIPEKVIMERRNWTLPKTDPKLGIFSEALFTGKDSPPVLAFQIEELGYMTYIGANNGNVLLQYDNVKTARNRETYTANNSDSLPGTLLLAEDSLPCDLAGYDLLSPDDEVLAFNYDNNNGDDLFLYRPGRGCAWVAQSKGDGTFTAVYAVGDNGSDPPNGVADYDLLSPSDRVLAFDYNGDGNEDLFLYRPGRGCAWVARSNGDGTFTAVYAVGDNGSDPPNGIAGYDLLSPYDEVLVFNYDGDNDDDLFLYRPGRGCAWVASSNGDGTFTAVYAIGDNGSAPPNGIADYDLLSPSDRVLVFNYNGKNGDKYDDLFLCRPGRGCAWVARSNGDGTFTAVYAVGDNGSDPPNGIADYDLLSPSDKVLAFDYDGDGNEDLFLYRPGRGCAWVARSNGDGTFTAVYAVGDNGSDPPNGIAGYDLLSPSDKVLAFDYDGNGSDDLFLYRPGKGAAWVARSNGDGTFTAVYAVGDNW